MSIDVHFHGTHTTLFPWGLALLPMSALIFVAAVVTACEILYRRVSASRSK
jgi:hypothetical protein